MFGSIIRATQKLHNDKGDRLIKFSPKTKNVADQDQVRLTRIAADSICLIRNDIYGNARLTYQAPLTNYSSRRSAKEMKPKRCRKIGDTREWNGTGFIA